MTHVPTDSGWAWMVLVGATMEMAISVGIIKASGILFVAFQDHYDSTSAMTSLLSTVQNAVFSVSALFVMTVGMNFTTCRNLVFTGSAIVCSSFIMTSLAKDINVVLVSYGVILGIGLSFMMPTALTIVSVYFEKRRGFANCIAVSGSSFGGLVFAPLISHLLTQYGYQGCVLLLAGIMLHGFVCGALFRPPSFYDNRKIPSRKDVICGDASTSTDGNECLLADDTRRSSDSYDLPNEEERVDIASEETVARMNFQYFNPSEKDAKVNSYCRTTQIDAKSKKLNENTHAIAAPITTNYDTAHDGQSDQHYSIHHSNSTVVDDIPGQGPNSETYIKLLTPVEGLKTTLQPLKGKLSRKPRIRCYSENNADEMRKLEHSIPDKSRNAFNKTGELDSNSQIIRSKLKSGTMFPSSSCIDATANLRKRMSSRVPSANVLLTGSLYDIAQLGNTGAVVNQVIEAETECRQSNQEITGGTKQFNLLKTLSDIFDTSLLKLPIFLAFEVAAALIAPGTMLCTIFIAPHARDCGMTVSDVATLVTIFNFVDLCARISIAMISDRGWLRRSSMVVIASVVVSITAHCLRFYSSFGTFVLYSVVLGLFNGVYFSQYAVIIVDYLTLERLKSALGFTYLCHGFTVAGTFYIVGQLRDMTGSYILPFHLLGAMTFIGAIMMLLLPIIEKAQRNKLTSKAVGEIP